MSKRIAFTGSSGTGKSTLAEYVAQKLGLPMNPIGSREVAAQLGFIDLETGEGRPFRVDNASLEVYTAELQMDPGDKRWAAERAVSAYYPGDRTCRGMFQRVLLEAKIAWESERDEFVTDRTTIDNLTYSALYGVRSLDTSYIEIAQRHVSRYDIIFFTPMVSFYNPAGDQARRSTDDDQFACDAAYEAMLLGFYGRAFSLHGVDGDETESYEFENNSILTVGERDLSVRKAEIDRVLIDMYNPLPAVR